MNALDFIQDQGVARATRILQTAPSWAVYYDAEKRCYDDIKCESSVSLQDLIDVLVGCEA